MRLLLNLTKGDHVQGYRRAFVILYPVAFIVLLLVGVLFDATPELRSPLLNYTAVFVFVGVLTFATVAIPGILYSIPRFLRERAIARSAVHPGLLLELYLTRDLQAFVEFSSSLRLNTVVESITLEFLPEGVTVWHGARRPRTDAIPWPHFPVLKLLETGQVELTPADATQHPFCAFVPAGVLGIRRRGLPELIASIEELRP